MPTKVDCFVIGAGPAGICAANILSKSGKKTVIVGKTLGGSFCYDGRVVLSSLLHISSLYDRYKQTMQFLGDTQGTPASIDFKRIRKYVDGVISKVCKVFVEELNENGAEYVEGSAEFTGQNSVIVNKIDGTSEEYIFDKCILAVGAAEKKLNALSGAKALKISTILNFESIPSSVVIIGGGLVGLETAAFFSRLGSKVTIIEKNDKILSSFDPQIVKKYEDALKKKNIDVITSLVVQKIEKIGQKFVIFYDDGKLESEEVFVCIGKTPVIDGLCLEKAGIVIEDNAPCCDFELKTDNPNIYLAGDVTGMRMRSGWAFHSAAIAAKNILGKNVKYNPKTASAVLSVDPEIASVGITEEEAKKLGYDCGTIKYTSSDIHKAVLPAAFPLFVKVVYDKESKTFLGLQAIGRSAIDIASDFSIIIQGEITIDKAADFVCANPLFNEFISELAEKIK